MKKVSSTHALRYMYKFPTLMNKTTPPGKCVTHLHVRSIQASAAWRPRTERGRIDSHEFGADRVDGGALAAPAIHPDPFDPQQPLCRNCPDPGRLECVEYIAAQRKERSRRRKLLPLD